MEYAEMKAISEAPLMDITVKYVRVQQPPDTHVVEVTALTRPPLVRRYTDTLDHGYEKVFKEGEFIGRLGFPLKIISSTPSLIGRSPLPSVPFPRFDGPDGDPELDDVESITKGMKDASVRDKMDVENGMEGITTSSQPLKRGLGDTPGATARNKHSQLLP